MSGLESLSEVLARWTSAPPSCPVWEVTAELVCGCCSGTCYLASGLEVEMGTCTLQLIIQNHVVQHRGPYMLMNNELCLHFSALVYFS